MTEASRSSARAWFAVGLLGLTVATVTIALALGVSRGGRASARETAAAPPLSGAESVVLSYQERKDLDIGGFYAVLDALKPWPPDATLEEVRRPWLRVGYRGQESIDQQLADQPDMEEGQRIEALVTKASFLNYEGEPKRAYAVLAEARKRAEGDKTAAAEWLYSLIYFQGVTGLRLGENENCIDCRGESSCILPIAASAVHQNPAGSRLAIRHFTEYLEKFPDDLEARWLLNLAHMTLAEHPGKVDPRYLISLDRYNKGEADIGRFRDVGHLVGVNRLNMAGGAVMDDFDGDGLLDIIITSWDAAGTMAYYHNKGDGTFEDRAEKAGLSGQLGGLFLCQADYDNDGDLDLFVPRAAWLKTPVRPSLLQNDGDGRFRDATESAGLLDPVNSNSACWADYDNDGDVDLFVCCETQPLHLYRNKGDGTFEEVAGKAGIPRNVSMWKGANWIDVDNDDYPDLFLNDLTGTARLLRNNRDGTFGDVTTDLRINGPGRGFACWAWDYDNDGWLDIFATSYDRTTAAAVQGLLGRPHDRETSRLFRNLHGTGFRDVAREVGLDKVYATMGSNFGDYDNDGYLDMYLGTGDPNLATLVPNRMIVNQEARRFAEVTGPSGTGHLQKGHAVSCGDWDRDGDVDVFIQMGGATNGDRYHNILFQNPGHGRNWLGVRLVGEKSNRSALGARIKVVTAGESPLTVHRHVSSGSSFGSNPLEQHFGLGQADRVATLEVHWPTSGTTQVFRNIPAGAVIEIIEFASSYRRLTPKPIPLPAE